MGGVDKALVEIAGRPILDYLLERFAPQVGAVILNANGDPARFAGWAAPIVPDVVPGFGGPLVGVLSALEHAATRGFTHVASVPADGPFPPTDLVARLAEECPPADLARASSLGRPNPVAAFWPVALRDDLRRAIVEEGMAKVDQWTARHRVATVDFATVMGVDPFFNINTPEDLATAESLVARYPTR